MRHPLLQRVEEGSRVPRFKNLTKIRKSGGSYEVSNLRDRSGRFEIDGVVKGLVRFELFLPVLGDRRPRLCQVEKNKRP